MPTLNETPTSSRVQLAFFGRRNAGKSSLINALTKQPVAIVSPVAGTTTDPVSKSMELLPLGPVTFTDTPGLDDVGDLGALRVQRTREVLAKTDIALLVTTPDIGVGDLERGLIAEAAARHIRLVLVINKIDTSATGHQPPATSHEPPAILATFRVSALTGAGVDTLRVALAKIVPEEETAPLVADLVSPGDLVVCVCPIDSAAPKGRLILPQQQVVREVLDSGAIAVVCRETELAKTLASLARKPRFVITDSQAFKRVNADTPKDIPLTSFSIVFARAKGDLPAYIEGVKALKTLKDGDRVLISEGCTHHRQCTDIGTVKLPHWIKEFTGKVPAFEWTSGAAFPTDLTPYKLVIHCGACMLTRREVQNRIARARAQHVPITNYGVLIAAVHGIAAHPATCMVER